MQDNLENFQNEEKQMTALRKSKVGASSTCMQWNTIDWAKAQEQVRKLQMRIAKATREGKHNRAKALQWILTHSFHAKALAVKRITENTGGKTAGVDNIVWRTSKQKVQAIKSMQRRGYQPQSLRRIYIPKKNGRLRPLSIPTMKDRAMQALYLLALEPIAETQADKSSYGFRPKRSTADAIGHCFYALARSYAPQWILEGDIKACFDCIDHRWLTIYASIDKTILQKWLAAGYQEKGKFYRTEAGVPQGGIISPVLANIALDGLEQTVKSLSNKSNKVHVVRYADDFIVTGSSQEFLEQKIKPAIKQFLAERGLELSAEKTKVTSIQDGFDFLGFNVRKYKGKLLIKPAKRTVKAFLENIQQTIKSSYAIKTEELIWQLNPKIKGFANYYRHVVSKQTFQWIDYRLYYMLARWLKRRHPQKSSTWCTKKYYRAVGRDRWVFYAKRQNKDGKPIFLDLFKATQTTIKRHVKIQASATAYDPEFTEYFKQREERERYKVKKHVS